MVMTAGSVAAMKRPRRWVGTSESHRRWVVPCRSPRVWVRRTERATPDDGYRSKREKCQVGSCSQLPDGLLPFPALLRYKAIPIPEPESDDALMARFCDGA